MSASVNSRKILKEHKRIINRKRLLSEIYIDFYKRLKAVNTPKGQVVELGSGAGFLKEVFPKIVTSDVVPGNGIDKVFFAEKMPFRNKSVSAFVMLNVFHHIKDPEKAIKEMYRCLKVGGKIVMIEPYNSLWGRFVYKYLHYEHYDPDSGWKVKGKGRMSDSNTALPWIIFVRDRQLFEKRFPKLKITKLTPHTPFLYLITGGLTKPQLLPTFIYPVAKTFERLISPLNSSIGMFATVVLKKIK